MGKDLGGQKLAQNSFEVSNKTFIRWKVIYIFFNCSENIFAGPCVGCPCCRQIIAIIRVRWAVSREDPLVFCFITIGYRLGTIVDSGVFKSVQILFLNFQYILIINIFFELLLLLSGLQRLLPFSAAFTRWILSYFSMYNLEYIMSIL